MTPVGSLCLAEIKTYARILGKQYLSTPTLNWLRERSQKYRRTRNRKPSEAAATWRELADGLRSLGVQPGKDTLIHSSMSALGPVDGGAAAVYEAIVSVVGPDATILVPAYPMPGSMIDWMASTDTFDVQRTRSRMGAFTEYVRNLPGAVRSVHPTHSVAAIGPHAHRYVCDHHHDTTPAGPHSPFSRHMANGGQIVCLGTGIGKITSYHVVEDIESAFPVAPYLQAPMSKGVCLSDGSRHEVRTLIHDPSLSPWRIDNFGPKESEIRELMLADGILREGKVGLARASLVDAEGLLECLRTWARRGVTIYHSPMLGGFRINRHPVVQ